MFSPRCTEPCSLTRALNGPPPPIGSIARRRRRRTIEKRAFPRALGRRRTFLLSRRPASSGKRTWRLVISNGRDPNVFCRSCSENCFNSVEDYSLEASRRRDPFSTDNSPLCGWNFRLLLRVLPLRFLEEHCNWDHSSALEARS